MHKGLQVVVAAMSFACALAQAGAATVALSELDVSAIQQGWGTGQVNRSVAGLPLLIGGRAFTNGVGTHAPSLAVVRIDGAAERFHALVGINDGGRKESGSVEFVISGDSRELWRSGVLRGGDAAKQVDVSLAGVRKLKLEVTDAGDNNFSDHAVWAEAAIDYTGRAPELVDPDANSTRLYPPDDALAASPGDATYFVDPVGGGDDRSGRSEGQAWKSFARVNGVRLAPGDRVVIAPGVHEVSLKPAARGTADKPAVIEFLPGRHEFAAADAIRLSYFVSNSADAPLKPRPIGMLVKDCRHVDIRGGPGAEIWFSGERMTMFINERSEDIAWSGLTFDFVRPTVSEYRVEDVGAHSVVIRPAEGSTWKIEGGRFSWTGDLGPGWTMVQQADLAAKSCWRMGRWDPFGAATAEDAGGGLVRLSYASGNLGMIKGRQFQFRNVERDTTSAVNHRCKNVSFRDCNFHALPGMGIVSQFTEGLAFERVNVVPRPGTLRTCPAWADCFHFSGCRGDIVVDSCRFSGTQDDPINVHGTHLRLIEKTGPNQVLLRFMQPQTYGIAAFQPGDRVEFVNHTTLRSYATNAVSAIERKTDKDWLLTLERPLADFGKDDVVDNVSWYPNVTIRNCTVDTDSCRGFLITTRGKALVEGCTFTRTAMSAILVEDDAEGWFESGPIRDLTIRSNRFIQCANPVVHLNPQTHSSRPEDWVHENVRIVGNYFDGGGISARNVKGLTIAGNRFTATALPVQTNACTEVVVESNSLAAMSVGATKAE
jgi:hypothetical protein